MLRKSYAKLKKFSTRKDEKGTMLDVNNKSPTKNVNAAKDYKTFFGKFVPKFF
jgi:hypothetical protein